MGRSHDSDDDRKKKELKRSRRNKKETKHESSKEKAEDDDRKHRTSSRKRRRHHHDKEEDDSSSSYSDRRGDNRSSSKKKRSKQDDDDDDDHHHRRKHKHKKHRSKHEERTKKDHQHHNKKKQKTKHDKEQDSTKELKHNKKSTHTAVDKSKLTSLGPVLGHPPSQILNAETDYYTYHQHFWVYLWRDESTSFNDLTSDEARDAFARFVARYNAGELESAYYDPSGLPLEAIQQVKTTQHQWKFATSTVEESKLQQLQQGVRRQTEYQQPSSEVASMPPPPPPLPPPSASDRGPLTQDVQQQPRALQAHDRGAERTANRRLKEHVRTVHEELAESHHDKKDSIWARQRDKRQQVGERTHGASRDREAAGLELPDDVLYGDGGGNRRGTDDEFQAALARERQRKRARNEQQQQRAQELQQKEQAKQQDMLRKLGLSQRVTQPGENIKIAPRNDHDTKDK